MQYSFTDFISDYGLITIIALAISSFVAGFIDAVVGGGGLIQIPFLLIAFPNMQLPVMFGTNKIAALSGTATAAYSYAKKISFDFKLLFAVSLSAFVASYSGAQLVSSINSGLLKPVIFVILILIAVYTFLNKKLGSVEVKQLPHKKQIIYGSISGILIGFYDGFFGPGTGSFFVLAFVVLLGFEFVKASAYAKIINSITNLSALIVFISKGTYILPMAILMAVFNVMGSFIGSTVALKNGNGFVRIFFLVVVTLMIIKYANDIFFT